MCLNCGSIITTVNGGYTHFTKMETVYMGCSTIIGLTGIMEEACSSRSLQDNKTNSPSQIVY